MSDIGAEKDADALHQEQKGSSSQSRSVNPLSTFPTLQVLQRQPLVGEYTGGIV